MYKIFFEMKKKYFILLFFSFTLFFLTVFHSSCGDKNEIVPYVYVYFELDLNQPDMQALLPVGGMVFLNGGHRGIVVYHHSIDQFWAYDRACTYHPYTDCRVQESSQWGTLECDCCHSQYALFADGIVTKAPASVALLKYNVNYIASSQILIISN